MNQTTVNLQAVRNVTQDKEDSEILDWLTPEEYGTDQSNNFGRRQPESCQWFPESREYQEWLKSKNKTVFCPGIPGAGKKILTSILINELEHQFQDQNSSIAYIYFDYKCEHDQRVEDLLASLLKQLARDSSSLPKAFRDLHNRHRSRRTRPSREELMDAIRSTAAQYSRIFLVIDALDECQASEGRRSCFLKSIFDLQSATEANIFTTSRDIPDILSEFQGVLRKDVQASKRDVLEYIDGQLSNLPRFVKRDNNLKDQVKTKISEAVNGMYAALHISFIPVH